METVNLLYELLVEEKKLMDIQPHVVDIYPSAECISITAQISIIVWNAHNSFDP